MSGSNGSGESNVSTTRLANFIGGYVFELLHRDNDENGDDEGGYEVPGSITDNDVGGGKVKEWVKIANVWSSIIAGTLVAAAIGVAFVIGKKRCLRYGAPAESFPKGCRERKKGALGRQVSESKCEDLIIEIPGMRFHEVGGGKDGSYKAPDDRRSQEIKNEIGLGRV